MTTAVTTGAHRDSSEPMTAEEKKVIIASSAGTVFEWYDFYLYGALATSIIGPQFFSAYPDATQAIFALLAFAAGFIVRPFGALVFGRLGDLIGRKHTFLITILIMGLSTFFVGLLPNYETIGTAAPVTLILLRMAQGLALGGEYGGAATYVAEHAPSNQRGYFTSWIQTTATLGLLLSLIVIMFTQIYVNTHYPAVTLANGTTIEAFKAWGWRIPFLASIVLLAISLYIRLQMAESPAFKKMKDEGKHSDAPLKEAFGTWSNAKIALLALFGLTAGQGVVWYTGQFYALFFLQKILKVDEFTANVLIAWALILGTGFFIVFGDFPIASGANPSFCPDASSPRSASYRCSICSLKWQTRRCRERKPPPAWWCRPILRNAASSSTRRVNRSSRRRATSPRRCLPSRACNTAPNRPQRARSPPFRSTAARRSLRIRAIRSSKRKSAPP